MIELGGSHVFTVTSFPKWKERIVYAVMRLLNMRGAHYMLFVTEQARGCADCNGTGRLMTVDTYETIDCPACDGRG